MSDDVAAREELKAGADTESVELRENISAVHGFYAREELKLTASQRCAENLARFLGRPSFLIFILSLVVLWIVINLGQLYLGWPMFEEPPFAALQGLLGLVSVLTTIVVLIKQNRVSRLNEQRDHLHLKVTLLIEQKAAKLVDLLEELRRDLPNVKDRHDSGAAVMLHAMSPLSVLAALDEEVVLADGSVSTSTALVHGEPYSSTGPVPKIK